MVTTTNYYISSDPVDFPLCIEMARHIQVTALTMIVYNEVWSDPQDPWHLILMTNIGVLNGVSVHNVPNKYKTFWLLYLCELFD